MAKQAGRKERERTFALIEHHYQTTIEQVLGFDKWLKDTSGRNYITLISRGLWHGISDEMMEAECGIRDHDLSEGVPAIGHITEAIEVFAGSLGRLTENLHDLYKTHHRSPQQQYPFKCEKDVSHLRVKGRGGCILALLEKIGTAPLS